MLRFGSEEAHAIKQFDGMNLRLRKDKENGKLRLATAEGSVAGYEPLTGGRTLDISWLPFCADRYKISPRIEDYIMTEIPIVTAVRPNRNLDAFPMGSLTEFNPNVGRIAYQTFIGKPTHIDHDNREPLKAKGVIFDARMVMKEGSSPKVHILAGWDRTKDADLVRAILRKERTGHSMGAIVEYTRCSIPNCGMTSPDGRIPCNHMEGGAGKGRTIRIAGRNYLVYEECCGINFIESSSVGDPADFEAHQRWVQ
jgi:hypothetical protein